MSKKYIFIILLSFNMFGIYGQQQFKAEVEALNARYNTLVNTNKKLVVFTGSSSIRMWHDVDSRFSRNTIINTGFGGSTT